MKEVVTQYHQSRTQKSNKRAFSPLQRGNRYNNKPILRNIHRLHEMYLKMIINYVKLGASSQWLTDRYSGNLCFGYLKVSLSINA